LGGESGSLLQHLKGLLDVVREIVLSNDDLQMLLKLNEKQSFSINSPLSKELRTGCKVAKKGLREKRFKRLYMLKII
jgi:hypothetical protein